VGQAQTNFGISALPRFQYYVFSFLMPAHQKSKKESAPHSSPDPSCGAETKSKNPFLKN
jgi:hypothetical protein